jgi:polyisoprenyl-phosphate glycosyltransferase
VTRKALTVIAPVFNEEEVIERFHDRLSKVLDGLSAHYDATMLFVLDRSGDRTLEILRGIASGDARVQVIALSARFGHQMSLLAGIDHARDADIIVMMDGDLQHPPETIPEMLEAHAEGFDIVYTVRRDTEGAGLLRKTAGNAFYRLLTYLSRVPINENAADFRLISRRVADVMRRGIRERNMFLRGLFSWMGFNQRAVHFDAARREAGRSKYTLSRMMGLATAAILSFSTKPLQVGIFLGLTVAAVSVVLMVFTLVEWFIDDSIPSGWTTLAMLLLMFSGVQLIVMGILGAYIGGIYEEVKARPHYIVDETINLRHEKS